MITRAAIIHRKGILVDKASPLSTQGRGGTCPACGSEFIRELLERLGAVKPGCSEH